MSRANVLCSLSNLSVTSPTSHLILLPFRRFIYVTAHSPTLPLLHLSHSSFSNPSVAWPTSHLSPTLPSLHLRHSSFSNPSVASATSQLILQPFLRISYVTGSSPMSPGEPPMIWNVTTAQHNWRSSDKWSGCYTFLDSVLYPSCTFCMGWLHSTSRQRSVL